MVLNRLVTGTRLREARIRSEMTVKEVRAALDITRETTIYEWESGKFLPSIEHLYHLSKLYHTSIEGFLAFEGGESAFYRIDELKVLDEYTWFTDIEFNPGKSINSQARSVALLKKVIADNVQDILTDTEKWTEYHRAATKFSY